jgi:hypothetical protein
MYFCNNVGIIAWILCSSLAIFATMKFVFYFLGFFLLSLSCIPCSDNNECDLTQKKTEVSAFTSHEQHNHDMESCTPFCTCSCCAASAFYYHMFRMQGGKILFQSEKFTLHNVGVNSEVYYSIWQPPKFTA